jgi:hypothetical protein
MYSEYKMHHNQANNAVCSHFVIHQIWERPLELIWSLYLILRVGAADFSLCFKDHYALQRSRDPVVTECRHTEVSNSGWSFI